MNEKLSQRATFLQVIHTCRHMCSACSPGGVAMVTQSVTCFCLLLFWQPNLVGFICSAAAGTESETETGGVKRNIQ